MKLYITGGHAVLPDKVLSDTSVLIADDRIAAIGVPCPEGAKVIDAAGGTSSPALSTFTFTAAATRI